MKSLIKSIFYTGLILIMVSCLENGLDELPAFEDADITGMSFEYRWNNNGVADVERLDNNPIIDNDAGTVQNTVTVPSSVDPTVANSISLSNLVGIVNISTAARIEPSNGAPKLGSPGNFSSAVSYVVTAADGTTKTWTITTVLN